ncbi:MAG TPA: hypothetical protein VKN63_10445 [Afifellaceae bacterium]|nr:hypothetical protein [Afifellaceae bacterium]
MSSVRTCFAAAISLSLVIFAAPAWSADLSCNNLVPPGAKLVCPGFEPNWAVEFICEGEGMTANFVDAFSSEDIIVSPGDVNFLSEEPWGFTTSHGVSGLITSTPEACQDESDQFFDFTMTTTEVPGIEDQAGPICCRME